MELGIDLVGERVELRRLIGETKDFTIDWDIGSEFMSVWKRAVEARTSPTFGCSNTV